MKRPLLVLAALVWVSTGTVSLADVRIWTNLQGKKIEAKLIEAGDSHVVLEMAGKGQFNVQLATLSESDREFAAQWLEAKHAGEAASAGENWDAPWPKNVKTDVTPDIQLVTEDAETSTYVYHSPSFAFHCDVKLSKSVVERFAVLFEATAEYCRQMPLSMEKAHSKKRHQVQLFEKKSTYIEAGAPAGSAGVYMPGKDVVMVPLTSLGVERVGNRFIMDHDKSNKTLGHEIVHQMTDREYYLPGARGWFSEGLAEYIGLTPYRMGTYTAGTARNSILEFVTAYGADGNGGRALGEEITLPRLEQWFMIPYQAFLADPQVNYGSAALIFYYFAHMDGDKEASHLKAFCQALKSGQKGQEALEVLRAGRSYEELEEEVTKAWRGRGVRFHFQ